MSTAFLVRSLNLLKNILPILLFIVFKNIVKILGPVNYRLKQCWILSAGYCCIFKIIGYSKFPLFCCLRFFSFLFFFFEFGYRMMNFPESSPVFSNKFSWELINFTNFLPILLDLFSLMVKQIYNSLTVYDNSWNFNALLVKVLTHLRS